MKEENWALSIMQTLLLDLRNFARRADRRCGGKPGERQEKAAGTMMQVRLSPTNKNNFNIFQRLISLQFKAFRVCVSDNRAGKDDTKKWGMLFVVNQLFKVKYLIL